MRRRRPWPPRLYLGAAAALAVAAAMLSRGYLASARVAGNPRGPEATVVVAASSIERGSVLAPAQLRIAHLPSAYAPPGFIDQVSEAAGRVVLADLAPGEVVTRTRLARVRAGPVASLVPRGLRAFAVPTSLPRGSLIPGDRVDIIATYASGQPHSEVVVEGIEVLLVLDPSQPVGQGTGLGLDASGAGAGPATTLILLVSSDQEERLAFARAFANLEVVIEAAE